MTEPATRRNAPPSSPAAAAAAAAYQHIDLGSGADLLYFPSALGTPEDCARLYDQLLEETPWQQTTIKLFGKEGPSARRTPAASSISTLLTTLAPFLRIPLPS
jgi:hypothetical protein